MTGRRPNIKVFSLSLILILAALVLDFPGHTQAAWLKPVSLPADIRQGGLNCIYQDKTGLVWIGTGTGTFSYDGKAYQRLNVPGSYADKAATALYQDSENVFWIGYDDGSVLANDRYGIFTSMRSADDDSKSRITSFVEDGNGRIWIGTYGNGVMVHGDTSTMVLNAGTGLSDNFIYTMISDRGNNIWMGTDNGLNIVDPSKEKEAVITLTIEDGLPDFIVQCLRMDEQGDIWAGMYDKGICRFDHERNAFIIPPGLEEWEYGVVKDLIIMKDRIWIATSARGILEYMISSHSLNFYEHCGAINLNRTRSMLHDKEGNIWLMTGNEICLSFGNKIEFFERFGTYELRNIHALMSDADDRLWFADDRGLYSYNPYAAASETEPKRYPLAIDLGMQKIMSLYRDHYGYVWVGTFGQGLIRLDPINGDQVLISEEDGLVNGNILSIDGNAREIWFGTLGGASLCMLDERLKDLSYIPEFSNYGLNEGLVNNYIYQVYLAGDGTPYFATDGNGVQVYRNGVFENILPDDEFSDEVVYSVTLDEMGKAWINTANKGLYKYDGEELVPISGDSEHANTSFSGILSNRHELIMAHDEGIDVADIRTGSVKHFAENAGISGITPDLNTLAKDSRGNVWTGTSRGIIKYQPQDEKLWDHPMINLTEVALFLDRIDHSSLNIFGHSQNHLSFRYSGLWYQNPERVEYLFKLDGHNLDWISTKNNQVIFSDLKPGQYTFRVKAGINGNYGVSREATYTFQIRNPFYATLWFYLLAVLFAGVAVTLIISFRVKQVKRKEEIIQEKIRFQFENLKSQINPHFLFNSFSTLIALIEDDSPAAVNYVEELSMLFRNILEYKDHDLISLEKEITIAGSYINLQKKRFGDSLIVEFGDPDSFAGTHIPPLTLQLLIENAIKHNVVSKEKPLAIRIYGDPGENRIFVENNIQAKMENTPSTGVGINNILNRYRLLTDRDISINRTDSLFSVGLPFIK